MTKSPRSKIGQNSLKNKKATKSKPIGFEILFKNIALPLMKFIIKRMGGDEEAAEEVFARTSLAAWEGWRAFKNKSSFFTWICKIALNKIADYYREEINRDSKFVAPLLEDIAGCYSNDLLPEEKLAINELRASVRACIKLLPEEKKRLLFLRYWKELSIKQIARQLGTSERAIEAKLYRARKRLNKIIFLEYPELVYEYSGKQRF